MIAIQNPSGCLSVRYRIYRPRRVTLLQRIARAFAAHACAMVEHLDQLGSRA